MTTTPADTDRRTSAADWAPWVEVLSSAAACLLVVGLFVNWLGVHLTFFGEEPVASASDVRHYWVIVALLAAAIAGSFAGALSRGAGGALVWHVLVGLGGVAAAVLFAVTTVGPVEHAPTPAPQPSRTGPLCYSGGDDSGCPGG